MLASERVGNYQTNYPTPHRVVWTTLPNSDDDSTKDVELKKMKDVNDKHVPAFFSSLAFAK
jgi:hypothetical protein